MSERTRAPISNISLLALGAPAFPMFALMMPLVVFIPAFYADYMGLGMAAVGTAFLVARVFDAVTDPLAGAIMDKTQGVISRKAWVIIGAVPLFIAIWRIFVQPASGDTVGFMFWLLVLYAGWTLMSVGLYSWAGEVSENYDERSRIMGAIQIANSLGTISVLVLPVFLEIFTPERDLSLIRIQVMGGFVLISLPIVLIFAWLFAPIGQARETPGEILPALKQAVRNPSLRRLMLADFLVGFKIGVTTALGIFFIEIVSGLSGKASIIQLMSLCASLIAIPFFVRIAERLEKHHVLVLNALAAAIAGGVILIAPPGVFWIVVLAYVLFGVASGTGQLLIRSIMADVVHEDCIKTGNQNSGLYFSFLTTTLKLSLSLGVTMTFWVAAWLGFEPALARVDDNSHWVVRVLLGITPIIAVGFLALAMWKFPLTRAVQEKLRLREASQEKA